jgi:glycosyltransferase involved in cell wall biosynthesis
MLWLIISKILNPQSSIQGWTSMLVIILFLGGIQLISIGILGEYIGRIYREAKKRPLYIIADRLNLKN